MWGLLALSPWRVVLAIGCGVVALGSGLGLAGLAAWLIARAWQMPPVLDLSIAVVAVRALGISRGLFRYLERLATHDVALRAMTTARTSVYRTLARSDVWLRRPRRVSEDRSTRLRRGDLLVGISSDIDDLGAVVVRVFVPVAVAAVLSIAAIGVLATLSVLAAGILAAALAVAGILAPWLSARAARDAEQAVRADRAEFTAHALTVLDHAAELRVAGRLDEALATATVSARRAVAAEDSAALRTALAAAATPLSIGASVLGALLIGIGQYGHDGGAPGAMSPMALVVLVLLPLSAFEAVGALPAAAQALTTARAALHRLVRFENGVGTDGRELHEPRELEGSGASGQPGTFCGAGERGGLGASDHAFRDSVASPAQGPHAHYAELGGCAAFTDELPGPSAVGATTVPASARRSAVKTELADPPLRESDGFAEWPQSAGTTALPNGRRIAVVGPSGAGKSMLLMAWAGLLDTPTHRDVAVDGATFFAEDAHLFGTSILENLRVARGELTGEEAERALRAVGLDGWLTTLPDGIHTELVGGADAVSGGQRRRLLLARALVSPARVLLLDEPTEHMEAEAGAQLLGELLDVHSGLVEPDRIVVVVTHQLPADHRAEIVLRLPVSGQVNTESSDRDTADFAPREIPLLTR
ncbi:ATP-binding cassette domain-containing protein [Nocardia callitridis]